MSDSTDDATHPTARLDRWVKRLDPTGKGDEWTDRYLLCEHLVDPPTARMRQRFEAIARFSRDLIADRWVKTRQARENAKPKRIYYLSMEFLIGRALNNNIINMCAEPIVARAIEDEGWDLSEMLEQEPDAGLGNGGLGRLAACFMDSLATMQYSAMGYGLRYEYGIFRQVHPQRLPGGGTGQLVAAPRSLGDRASGQGRVRCRFTRASSSGARRSPSCRTSHRGCSASRTTGRSSGTARGVSTPCGSGRPPRPSTSTSSSSRTAISSAP